MCPKCPSLTPEILLSRNKEWQQTLSTDHPTFFADSVSGELKPDVFWIGCTDSRESEGVITRSVPGEICALRNVAGQVSSTDVAGMAALELAVTKLQVEHIIVTGHTRCDPVENALNESEDLTGAAAIWLAPLRESAKEEAERRKKDGEAPLTTEDLVVFNVKQQVKNILESKIVRGVADGTVTGRLKTVRGWLYHLEDGLIEELFSESVERKRVVGN